LVNCVISAFQNNLASITRFAGRPLATALRLVLRSGENGSALVEFTILMPVLFLIVFGIIEYGSIFSLQNAMLNAAREAARTMAVVQGSTASQGQSIATQYLTGYPETFIYNIRDHCLDSPQIQDVTVAITTDGAAASLINFMHMFDGTTLSASVTMRKESACS
jgi:Flp pilus assembly protein TadG